MRPATFDSQSQGVCVSAGVRSRFIPLVILEDGVSVSLWEERILRVQEYSLLSSPHLACVHACVGGSGEGCDSWTS